MTDPIVQQQPEQAYNPYTDLGHGGGGSVGAVVAVLAVITMLGIIAAMIGRLCSGRSIMGYGHFDVEAWIEAKCSSCVDGHVDTAPSRPRSLPTPPRTRPLPAVTAAAANQAVLESPDEEIKAEPKNDEDEDEEDESSDDNHRHHQQHHNGSQISHAGS
ncbi:hypothetical protein Ancab_018165 [Ancistrocladus abbreviatus]